MVSGNSGVRGRRLKDGVDGALVDGDAGLRFLTGLAAGDLEVGEDGFDVLGDGLGVGFHCVGDGVS